MDTDLLKTFLVLAQEAHMTRAASRLHLTQPAVSAQLKRLEDELGQRLFERGRRGTTLTEAGRLFEGHARHVLDGLERGKRALDQLAGLERGTLSIGGGATAMTYLLPPLLARFHKDHPGIHLFVREQGSANTMAAVRTGELELGIITMPIGGQLERQERDALHTTTWVRDELRLITPPGHRLEHAERFEWSHLNAEPLVLFEAGAAVRTLLDHRLSSAGIAPRVVMELRSIETIKRMVAQGIGLGFVSALALAHAEEGLTSVQDPVERQLAIVRRKDRPLSPAASVFFERLLHLSNPPLRN